MNHSRAQGISMNTIIIAAIALVVLVVVVLIFVNKLGDFRTSAEACKTKQGDCKPVCAADEAELPGGECPTDKPRCCVKMSGN